MNRIFLFKILGFDNVAKLLKNLIDDILAKGDVDWNQIVSVVSTRIECKNRKSFLVILGSGFKWCWTIGVSREFTP